MRRLHCILWAWAASLALAAVAQAAGALDVAEARWGFDGAVQPGRINLLSVRVTNPSRETFDGVIALAEDAGIGRSATERFRRCYLSPGASRWVQFCPFVTSDYQDWRLRWRGGSFGLPRPRVGPPCRVVLVDAADPRMARGDVRRFPADIFPVTVCATDGLHSVIVDHPLRSWERLQRETFLDWLRRGGIVHLTVGPTGEQPVFGSGLEALNAPGDRFRVGAGLVVRHDLPTGDATAANLAGRGYRAPLRVTDRDYHPSFDDGLFVRVRALSRPEHNWPVIVAVCIVYALLIGVGHWLTGRRLRDWRKMMVVLAATVGLAGWLLHDMGRRGYDEVSLVHGFGTARLIEGGRYDVTQWVNAFVTDGRAYEVTGPGARDFFGASEAGGSAGAEIWNGAGGVLRTEIPVFSSCGFMQRGVAEGPDLGLSVQQWRRNAAGGLETLAVDLDGVAPREALAAYVRYRGEFYRMTPRAGGLAMGRSADAEFFGGDYYSWQYHGDSRDATARDLMNEATPALIRHALGMEGETAWTTDDDGRGEHARLFIVMPSPHEFAVQGEGLGRYEGYVVYDVDVFPPEEK